MSRLLFFLFCVVCFPVFSQIGPRTWQDHVSLNYCNSVAKLGSKIYASNSVGIVRFDEAEMAPESVTKINGLSDVGVTLLRTNPYNNKLLICYQNCNIDVVNLEGSITNYADFKLKILSGKKTINEVAFYKQYAYIACGFGIVLFDTDKLEIRESYIIGPGGNNLEVYQVALTDSIIFAATPNGLYKSNFKTKDLTNYNNWQPVAAIPQGPYVGVVTVDKRVIAGYSPHKGDPTMSMKDTLYIYDSNGWNKFFPSPNGYTVYKMCTVQDTLFSYVDDYGVLIRSINTGKPSNYITTYNGDVNIKIADCYYGLNYQNNVMYWVADENHGLYHTLSYWPYYKQENVTRNGIDAPLVNNIDVFNGQVAVSPSHPDDGGGSIYTREGLNVLKDGDWSYIKAKNPDSTEIVDITYVLLDRYDNTRMWASSWFSGLLEYKNNKLISVYNASNTPMSEVAPGNPRVSGLCQDADGNLWFGNSDVPNFLSVRKKNGTFQTFNFGSASFTRKILVDKNNYVWALHEREGGITVFKHNNFSSLPVLNATYRLLTKDVTNGNLQSNSAFSIVEDRDGKIWVGTAAGVVVFYNPTSLFNSNSYDAQPIKIVQDGNVELLLGKEVVTSIAIDGANNKWMGTQTGGVYCFSPDGLRQLYHFTTDNSPLYSNYVIDLNYNAATGDMFFGTDIGLQSFRSTIVAGEEEYSTIFAYPNPVRPNYGGTVLVRGLIDNSIVKIVDESGNIVWETKSTGGQIEWPVTTFGGGRVTPGVYIVYATSTDGQQKASTKLLVIN